MSHSLRGGSAAEPGGRSPSMGRCAVLERDAPGSRAQGRGAVGMQGCSEGYGDVLSW